MKAFKAYYRQNPSAFWEEAFGCLTLAIIWAAALRYGVAL